MDASSFIASRLRFKGRLAAVCIAVSFLVMIIAVAVSSGYRSEIRSGLSSFGGDVQILPPDQNILDEHRPVESEPAYLPYVEGLDYVEEVIPVVYRAGIVRHEDNMYGIMLKGIPGGVDSTRLAVSIPDRLSQRTGLKEGDKMLTYFAGDKVSVRQFQIVSVYESVLETDDRHLVYASVPDLQRLNGWDEGQVSALEILLADSHSGEDDIRAATQEIGTYVNAYSSEDEESVIAVSSVSRFQSLFNWLDLIDFNVMFILLLMTIVAGFNMISGLLIMIFEHISMIGLLKSMGMTDRSISKVFLSSSAVLTAKGMAIGNLLAFAFCMIQQKTHFLKLDPENYYVSFVPVDINLWSVLAADAVSFAVIMLLLLLPCIFISKIDPADTVRVR